MKVLLSFKFLCMLEILKMSPQCTVIDRFKHLGHVVYIFYKFRTINRNIYAPI